MRDLAQTFTLPHALLLLAIVSAAIGAWEAFILAVPSIIGAAFLTYVAVCDAVET